MSEYEETSDITRELYRHTLELLKNTELSGGIHLDIGCALKDAAQTSQDCCQPQYVGVNSAIGGIQAIKVQNTEASVDFEDVNESYDFLNKVINGRNVAVITLSELPGLNKTASALLAVLHIIASEHNAFLVVSAANISNQKIVLELLSNRFDTGQFGVSGFGCLAYYTEKRLNDIMRKTGWVENGKGDLISEPHNLSDCDSSKKDINVILENESLINNYIRWFKQTTDPNASVSRFIRSYLPMAEEDIKTSEEDRPFLSIITRTQGKRINALQEVFLCLSAQTCLDFEVLVMGHMLEEEACLEVERSIDAVPGWLRQKIRLIRVDSGTRTTPLITGFANARGHYIAILDDDDIIFANWVETFCELYEKYPGRVLRTNCVRQNWTPLKTKFGKPSMRAIGSMKNIYTKDYDVLQQFYLNSCPLFTLAFPSSAYHDLGISFDETLTTTEDWDFQMRTSLVCGVGNSTAVTCIYRWWINAENSLNTVPTDEWNQNYKTIVNKLDEMPILLPPGSASQIRSQAEMKYRIKKLMGKIKNQNSGEPRDSLYLLDTSLYIDNGKGFNENQHLYSLNVKYDPEFEVVFPNLESFGKTLSIRWDPAEDTGICIESLTGEIKYKSGKTKRIPLKDAQSNGIVFKRILWFPVSDPMVIIPVNNEIASVRFYGKWSTFLNEDFISLIRRRNVFRLMITRSGRMRLFSNARSIFQNLLIKYNSKPLR